MSKNKKYKLSIEYTFGWETIGIYDSKEEAEEDGRDIVVMSRHAERYTVVEEGESNGQS